MPLVMYQVGNVPVFQTLEGVGSSGVKLKADRKWTVTTDKFHNIPGQHIYNDPSRPLADNQQISLDGAIVADNAHSIDQTVNKLMSLGGRSEIPFIAFHYEDRDGLDLDSCANCEDKITWLLNTGVVTNITRNSELGTKRSTASLAWQKVKIAALLDWRWQVLNPWTWEYRINSPVANPLSPDLQSEVPSNIFEHPKTFRGVRPKGEFFNWRNDLTIYTPSAWASRFNEDRQGGVSSNFVDFGSYEFWSDPSYWSAPPSSAYAFSDLSLSGSISIEVRNASGLAYGEDNVTTATLDLAQLNTQLDTVGYFGLRNDDIILTGDVQPFPGLVVRDNEIIPNIRPEWIYDGVYPGETFIGYNYTNFILTSASAKVAYIHKFGTY
jgi:hypothetical protein